MRVLLFGAQNRVRGLVSRGRDSEDWKPGYSCVGLFTECLVLLKLRCPPGTIVVAQVRFFERLSQVVLLGPDLRILH